MAKKVIKNSDKLEQRVLDAVMDPNIYVCPVRMLIPVSHRELDDTIVTSQGLEKSVKSLYEEYVMGVLTAKDLGQGSYDEEGSEDVDPLNTSGLTLEEASAIADAGRRAASEINSKSKSSPTPSSEESETKNESTSPAE